MFIVFSLLLYFTTSAMAADKQIKGPSNNIDILANNICLQYTEDGNKVAKNVKKNILDHMRIYEEKPNPSVDEIIHFLNHNKNYMTCGKDGKHYMKESFDHGRAYDQLFNVLFFDELLSDNDSLYIDINAISKDKAGNPETVLDYMYIQQADMTNPQKTRDEIKSLIETFEQFLGGKRYAQLKEDEGKN